MKNSTIDGHTKGPFCYVCQLVVIVYGSGGIVVRFKGIVEDIDNAFDRRAEMGLIKLFLHGRPF